MLSPVKENLKHRGTEAAEVKRSRVQILPLSVVEKRELCLYATLKAP
jgi:hypothetical protein